MRLLTLYHAESKESMTNKRFLEIKTPRFFDIYGTH